MGLTEQGEQSVLPIGPLDSARRSRDQFDRPCTKPIAALRCFCLMGLLCLTVTGCSNLKVKQPTSDSTPPALVWNIFNHGTGQQADHPGSPTLNAKRGEKYRLTLKANDPEGLKSIQINPIPPGSDEIWWHCNDPPGGENVTQKMNMPHVPMTQNLSPDANGMVLTSIFLVVELDFTLNCQAGWSFSGGSKLTGRASNYFGGDTTDVITFVIAP